VPQEQERGVGPSAAPATRSADDAAFITPIGSRHSQPAAGVHSVKPWFALEPASVASLGGSSHRKRPPGGHAWYDRLTGTERERATTLQVNSPKS
jgi:hypothetical protein